MDVAAHLAFFTHGIDPVTWMRVARILLFIASGLLMLKEPMMCGGRNQSFHRILAILFAALAFHSWDTAQARMVLITEAPEILPSITLLLSEIMLTLISIVVVVKLGYDYYEYVGYHSVNMEKSPCERKCHTLFSG